VAEAVISIPEFGEPFGYEQLTATPAVATLTAAKYKNSAKSTTERPLTARVCVIALSGANIRFTMDGTDPVAATTGHILAAGQTLIFKGAGKITKFKFVEESGTPVLDILYTL
jgi:hypothetical protein